MENNYYVKKISAAAPGVAVLELADKSGRPIFNFRPGQYVMISYKNNRGRVEDKHAFSLASSPEQKSHVRLGIRIQGNFTQGISKLDEGDEVFVSQPFGNFVFDENKHRNLVLLAGGIGITPFISILNYANDKKLSNKLSLLYSNRTVEGTVFFRELKELEKTNKNFTALYSITDEKIPIDLKGVVGKRFDKDIIGDFIGNPQNKHFFICGPMPFMNAIKESLITIGANEAQIEMEEFSMIPDVGFWAKIKNVSYAMGLSTALMFAPFYVIYSADQKIPIAASTQEQLVSIASAQQEENSAPGDNPPAEQTDSNSVALNSDVQPKTAAKTSTKSVLKPVTAASITEESATNAPNNGTNSQQQTTVQPVTSASAPAAPQTQQTQNQTTQNPAPTTSASGIAVATPPAQTPANQNSASTPAPTTSASTISSVPATSSAPSSTPSQPAPTTSASGVISSPAPSSGSGSTVGQPAPSGIPNNSRSNNRHEDEHEDDD